MAGRTDALHASLARITQGFISSILHMDTFPVGKNHSDTTEGFYSFESSGDIKRLNLSKKYVPGYLEIERIQKEAQRIGEELGRKAGLKEGRTTGLSRFLLSACPVFTIERVVR